MSDFSWNDMDLSDYDSSKLVNKYDDGWKTLTINSISIEKTKNPKYPGAINYFLICSNEIWAEKKICVWISNEFKHMAVAKFSAILSNHFKKTKKEVEALFKSKELTMQMLEPLLVNLSFKVWCEQQAGNNGKMYLTPTDHILTFGEKEYTPKAKEAKKVSATIASEDTPF
jgi:hypothetical protein